MNRKQRTYFAWLNNAYGQEIAFAKMYTMHSCDVEYGLNRFPELAIRLHEKAAESLRHAKLIESCLKRHGLTPNPAKIGLGWVMGVALGFTGDITIDKVIMNNLTDQGMAQFEVGAYLTLVAAAEEMKDEATAKICREILVQERATVSWLEKYTAETAQEFLKRT